MSNDGEVTRDDKGRFLPGVSGNPEGKPVGLRSRATQIKEFIEHANSEMLMDSAQDIMAEAIHLAKHGNEAMIKLLLGDMLKHVRTEETQKGDSGAIQVNISLMKDVQGEVINQESNEDN